MIDALCGTAPKRLKEALNGYGVRLHEIGPCNYLQEPLKGHIDLIALKWNEYLFVTPETEGSISKVLNEIYEEIPYKIIVTEEHLGKNYPEDVLLNIKIVGKTIIGNSKTMSKTVKDFFEKRDFDFINVKQGYTGCSILKVSDSFLITDDESIYRSVKPFKKIEKISKGSILLPGYDYGFIGGASLPLQDEILLFGDIDKSPVKPVVKKADMCKEKRFTSILKEENLIDIGGIIPLI